jgi:zinc and cadmium transporter
LRLTNTHKRFVTTRQLRRRIGGNDMLIWIVLACLLGGVVSLLFAWFIAARLRPSSLGRFIAFAAGTMLTAAMLGMLPEAFEMAPNKAHELCVVLFVSLLAFYLLQRAAIWRHTHEHDVTLRGVPAVIVFGDGVHNFVDGVLIAAAFLVDPMLGVTSTIAVVAHEVPQELGDFVLLLNAGWSKKKALLANGASSLASVLGGIVGWWALSSAQAALPYALMVAAASFIYIAVADLIPHLHRRHKLDGFFPQTGLLFLGIAMIAVIGELLHHH